MCLVPSVFLKAEEGKVIGLGALQTNEPIINKDRKF